MDLNKELNEASVSRIRLEEELAEYRSLFDLQRKRMSEAVVLWRANNPGNDNVWPDLGRLLEWLMQELKNGHRIHGN